MFCAVMILSNLEYPEWHLVSCSKKLNAEIVCTKNITQRLKIKRPTGMTKCLNTQILMDKFCYELTTVISRKNKASEKYKASDNLQTLIKHISLVTHIRLLFLLGNPIRSSLNLNKATETIESWTPSELNNNTYTTIVVHKFKPIDKFKTVNHFQLQTIRCSTGDMVSTKTAYLRELNCSVVLLDSQPVLHNIWGNQNLSVPQKRCPSLYFLSHGGHCYPLSERCDKYQGACNQQMSLSFLNIIHLRHHKLILSKKRTAAVIRSMSKPKMDCTEQEIKVIETHPQNMVWHCELENMIQCTAGCNFVFLL